VGVDAVYECMQVCVCKYACVRERERERERERDLLYVRVRRSSMSPAFLLELSMADILAPCSLVAFSKTALNKT
jgi:hypothetical protein